jgi:DNA invertase Pin-like site-specific DNA recombinase
MLVGYCRVSMADERQTTDLQRDALLAAGVDQRNIYEDRASGAKDDRPGLKACLDYLREGDILVVWRLDRLGRSLSHLIEVITGLKIRGIGFRSLNETIDTTNATGELLFHIFGALAQYERALIRERVLAGIRAAERRGHRGGRPRMLNQEKIEAARELFAGGRSMSVAARALGVPRSTLVDALKREPVEII